MNSQKLLTDTFSDLGSNKKRVKLAALENFYSMLTMNGVVKTLTANSQQEENVTWDKFYDNIHNVILFLVDEGSSKTKTLPEKHFYIIENVLPLLVQKYFSQKCLSLNVNLLASSVLDVFESSERIQSLGVLYLTIFSKHVMSERKNWCALKDKYWIGMKDVCKNHFDGPPSNIRNVLFLEILLEIVKFGSKNSQVSRNFLDLFDFLKEVYASCRRNGWEIDKILLHLTNTLCLQLAIEFRYKVCEFMESIFDFIILCHNERNRDKNTLVYHFFITTLSIHNPKGLWEKKTFYACNLDTWKFQIKRIFRLCHEEVKSILRNTGPTEIEADFLNLFVDVSNLMVGCDLENVTDDSDFEVIFDEPGPSRKRQCTLEREDEDMPQAEEVKLDESLLSHLNSSDRWFWLKFLEISLVKNSDIVKNQYCQLIEFLYGLVCEKKDTENRKVGLRCLCTLLEMEPLNTKDLTAISIQWLDDMWRKISTELLRSFYTETYLETHLLIRSLISHSKLHDIEPLIELYCNGSLKPELENFKTLCSICQYCILPEVLVSENCVKNKQQNCVKLKPQLLKWLLQGEEKFPCQDLARVLIALILKRFEEDIVTPIAKDDALISQINIDDFCQLITQNYLTVAFKDLKFTETNAVESTFEMRIENSMKIQLFDLLDVQYITLTSALNNEFLDVSGQLKALKDCLWFVELVGYILSHFECLNVECRECIFLTELLKSSLFSCSSKSLSLVKVKYFDLTCFTKLYSANYHVEVQKKIRDPEFIDFNFLQHLFRLFEVRYSNGEDSLNFNEDDSLTSASRFSQLISNPKSILHFQNLDKKEKLVVNVVEMLCQYITVPGTLDSTCYQTDLAVKIIQILTSNEVIDTGSNFYYQLVLRIVYSFTKFIGINDVILSDCMDLMQKLLSRNPLDFEVTITSLQVLKDLAILIKKLASSETKSKYKKIMKNLGNLIAVKKECGIKTTCKFIECLAEISKVYLGKSSYYAVLEEIISFLKHPYHEVRLTAAQNVGLLFVYKSFSDDSTIVWQKKMLKNLFRVLKNDSESISAQEKGYVEKYCKRVSSSVSLIACAGVICLSTYWRKKTLFYLLHLAFLKKFQNDEVEDIVKLICKELKINDEKKYISLNFSYLFYKWAKKGLRIEDFPFYLMGYKTAKEFMLSHLSFFVTLYSELGRFDLINTLSSNLEKPVAYLIEHSCAQLFSFVLPALNENASVEVHRKAQTVKRFVDKYIRADISFQWLIDSLDTLIFNMVRNMYDPPYLLSLCCFSGNFKDDKGPFACKGAQIVSTLEEFGKKNGKTILTVIAVERPLLIEKLLRLLLEDVVTAVIYEDQIFAFYKYIFFFEMISKITRKGLVYRKINIFIVRDVVYTLATIIQKNQDRILIDMACKGFKILSECYLEEFSYIIGQFLPAITTALTLAVKKGSTEASNTLKFLICQNYTKLETYFPLLDIFPSENIFEDINKQIRNVQTYMKDLKSTVKHFIRSGGSKICGCHIEGLKCLRKMLSDNKQELKEMYEELRSLRGFSEDCKTSLLHQLICKLVKLTSEENADVRVEASKCLGELGPSDLTTLVLRPENNFTVSKNSDSAVYRLLRSATNILSDLLISDNFAIKKAASKALYAILSTTQGRELFRGDGTEILESAEFLTPFLSTSWESLQLSVNKEVFLRRLHQAQLLTPKSHEKWIVNLSKSLLKSLNDSSGVIEAFVEMIEINWQFAENIYPMCLDLVLSLEEETCNEAINKSLSAFFEKNFHFNDKSPSSINKTTVQCILNVVDYIRMQRNTEGLHQRFDLDVNYLSVAKAALHCSAYFTAIFYAELWFENKRKNYDLYMDINMICEMFPDEGFALAEILRKCHFEIGNMDGVHGCGYMHILNPASEIQHYEHLKNWNLAMLHHDVQLSLRNDVSEIGLLRTLERSGMCYTVNRLIKTFPETPEMKSIQYKCAAQLGDWSQLDSTYKKPNNSIPACFDKSQYFTLKAFHNEDSATFLNECNRAIKSVMSELSQCSLESSKNIYLPLTQLQCLKELEEFADTVAESNIYELGVLWKKWDSQDSIKCNDFKFVDSVLTNRAIFIRDMWERMNDGAMKNCLLSMLCEIYYKLTVAARKEKNYESAIRAVSVFNDFKDVAEEIAGEMKVERARIMWEKGDREIGKFLLNYYLKKNEITGELKLKSLRMYGDWMAETKSENSREIIENYFLKSIPETAENNDRIHSYKSIGDLSYSMYEQCNEYLASPLFEIKQNLISTQQDLATELRQELGWNQNREKRMAYQIAAKQSAIDKNEIKNSRAERNTFLILALKNYLLSLKEGDEYDYLVFRVISLWFSNSNSPEVVQVLQELLPQIPTYKFLCLLPQLVPRMTDVCLISDLIERILLDHPHHTLPHLFALKNSYEDLKYIGAEPTTTNPRVSAASSLISKYETSEKLGPLISEMRRFSSALIELANHNPPDCHKSATPVRFPEYLQIRRIKNLTSVWVPSLHVPYKKSCVYDNVIGVFKFEPTYHLVGGINLPKRITCLGTDGINRSLLVKGRDDLRQDAVMQQVFTIMNSLLYQNEETSRKKLVIRTYKVVPLSQRSGIIEWCENTQPLSLYLTGPDGKSGAHQKYYPEDISAFECRSIIKKVFDEPQVTNEMKLKVFLDICKRLHPVFHNFFIEKFPAAGVWFERRLAYIHSVATSSMIGYILGIGDRHVHNILIDNSTAEVIHIDLGIAFEQGKTLPTPETVPFRLTRDIVDGMGSSGVNGEFWISCIKTMEVLRENKDTILTLLGVLLYDPLYTWTITPEKAYSIQNHTETNSTTTEKSSPDPETNKMAERALIQLKQKLQGTEAGFGATTVEGQVRILINEARDPNNLCRLFHGWQAYL